MLFSLDFLHRNLEFYLCGHIGNILQSLFELQDVLVLKLQGRKIFERIPCYEFVLLFSAYCWICCSMYNVYLWDPKSLKYLFDFWKNQSIPFGMAS
jgi:hypothetical protein